MKKLQALFSNPEALENKRFAWLDYDRGISIILVSFRHAYESVMNSGVDLQEYPFLEYINVFLFGFRMPLFFVASGIFLSTSIEKKGLNGYAFSRAQTILYPMLVWGCIQLTLQILFSGMANSSFGAMDYLWMIVDPRQTGQFWYLGTLFFVGIIYATLKVKWGIGSGVQLIVGILLYFLVAFFRIKHIYLGLLMDILQYYLFFAIGDAVAGIIGRHKTKKILSSYFLLVILVPLFMLIQSIFARINLKLHDNYFVEHNMPVFFLLVASLGCLLSINISFILVKLNTLKYLRVIGYHSIYIYCMQIIFMAITRTLLVKLLNVTYAPFILLITFMAGVMLPIAAYNLFMKANTWWLFSFRKPQKSYQYR